MAADPKELKDIEIAIADRIYIQVENWNLYLGDAGLAMKLAIECHSNILQGADVAARKALESVHVGFGGGNTKFPLARLIPPSQIFDLEEILDPYSR